MLTAGEFIQIVNTLGITVEWHQAKPPREVKNVRVVVSSIDKRNEAMLNAYGLEGKMFQIPAMITPKKLDQIVLPTGERYTLTDVEAVHTRGTGALVSYNCYCKGK